MKVIQAKLLKNVWFRKEDSYVQSNIGRTVTARVDKNQGFQKCYGSSEETLVQIGLYLEKWPWTWVLKAQ